MSKTVIPAKAGIHELIDPGFRRGDGLLPLSAAEPLKRSWSEEESFAYCTRITKGHYENFPVGSSLVPKHLAPAVHSLYAFMRTADDFSDENRRAGDDQERLAYIKTWDAMLSECEKGNADHPIFIALRATLTQYKLPAVWLHDLLHAFAMDCTVRRYATYEDLKQYCRYSANPVGRLILTLFGYREEGLYQLSDAICTALQLANHWQDVAVDLAKDRIYLPQEDMKRFGIDEKLLLSQASPGPAAPSPRGRGTSEAQGEAKPFRDLMAFEVARARALFEEGRALPDRVQGRLRWELRFTWAGGVRILEKIEKSDYDVLKNRPTVTKADWLAIAFRSIF